MHDPAMKAEAVRLRVEERKSFPEILRVVKVSKGTLSLWLREHPLASSDLATRRRKNGQKFAQAGAAFWAKYQAPSLSESPISKRAVENGLGTNQLGKLAEAAVLLRLVLQNFQVFGGTFDGECSDWVVAYSEGPFLKIQVKKTYKSKQGGAAMVSLTRAHSRGVKRYRPGDFDILVGYDLFTDSAYVWTWAETEHLGRTVSIRADALERWDKLRR
jgi:hypothetical protein